MFGSLGFNEMLFIMVLALLIFGPKRLPQIGRQVGRAMGEFRRATSDLKRSMEVEMAAVEETERAANAPTPAPQLAAGTQAREQPTAKTAEPSAELDAEEPKVEETSAETASAEEAHVDKTSAEQPSGDSDAIPVAEASTSAVDSASDLAAEPSPEPSTDSSERTARD